MKKLLRRPAVQEALAGLIARYVRLVHATTRWKIVNAVAAEEFWRKREPVIVCFWHGRMMMLFTCWPKGLPFSMVHSDHPDGLLMSRITRRFGYGHVFATRKGGGPNLLRTMVRVLRAGSAVGITPDGPRGPRMRASAGAIAVAKLTQAAILPLSFSISCRRVLATWDRMALAFPFGRGVYIWGEPIRVPKDADAAAQEALRLRLEAELNRITAEADRACGQSLVEPAAPLAASGA